MKYKAHNLIILKDGEPLFASRTCDLNVQTETIPVSSPSDGNWKHSIAGRKSWSLTTNHLVASPVICDGTIHAESNGYRGANTPPSFVIDGTGARKEVSARGISVIALQSTAPYAFARTSFTTWDTYNQSDIALSAMLAEVRTYLENASSNDYILAVVTYDAVTIPSGWVSVFGNYGNVTLQTLASGRHSLAAIGGMAITKGVSVYGGIENAGVISAYPASAQLFLQGGDVIFSTPLKDSLSLLGGSYTLSMNILGLPYDVLTGTAICKQFRVTGTNGNLIQGSFAFDGNGSLS